MPLCFTLIFAGFITMFIGLTGPGNPVILPGILAMAIGIVGSAVVRSRKREAERRYERAQRRAEDLVRR